MTPASGRNLKTLRDEAANCRACPLWKGATQTVFGEGPLDAAMIAVGEQPGDQEDLAGRPFVVLPWTSKLNKVLSAALPTKLRDVYLRRVGVYNSMDEFTGH